MFMFEFFIIFHFNQVSCINYDVMWSHFVRLYVFFQALAKNFISGWGNKLTGRKKKKNVLEGNDKPIS